MISGPKLEEVVLATLMRPMTTVLSFDGMMVARNAARGAISMDWMQDRSTRKRTDRWTSLGMGIKARNTADGI